MPKLRLGRDGKEKPAAFQGKFGRKTPPPWGGRGEGGVVTERYEHLGAAMSRVQWLEGGEKPPPRNSRQTQLSPESIKGVRPSDSAAGPNRTFLAILSGGWGKKRFVMCDKITNGGERNRVRGSAAGTLSKIDCGKSSSGVNERGETVIVTRGGTSYNRRNTETILTLIGPHFLLSWAVGAGKGSVHLGGVVGGRKQPKHYRRRIEITEKPARSVTVIKVAGSSDHGGGFGTKG